MGQHVDIETEEELARIKKTIENAGYYWTHQSREEFEQHTRPDPARIDALFKSLVYARVQEWLDLADERLAGKSAQILHRARQRRLVRDRRDDRRRQT